MIRVTYHACASRFPYGYRKFRISNGGMADGYDIICFSRRAAAQGNGLIPFSECIFTNSDGFNIR